MNVNFGRAAIAGIVGSLAMSAVGLWGAPMMGMAPMNPADMLAGAMGGNTLLGWAGHLMIGVTLALGYATVAAALPGPTVLRGALYSVAPWMLAQLAVMPMMGMGLFSGSMMMAGGSLIGHLVYGAVIGVVYGDPGGVPVEATA